MSTASQTPRRHPVAAVVARLHAELDAVTEVPVWTLDEAETEALLLEATRLRARVAALELRVAAHADRVEVGLRHGATSTANWWAHASRLTRAEAHRRIRLARSLQTHEDVAAALAAGEVVEDQAGVITHAVDELPSGLVDGDTIARARAHLLAEARSYDAKALRVLGRRVLEVIAPQVGEEHERRLLEAEERDARSACRFSMVEDGHGKTYGRFTLPTPQAQMLRKALLALAAPKHTRHTGHTPLQARRPSVERLGAAFCEYVESYPADRLPDAGGIPASVVVTISHDSLVTGLGSAQLDTGAVISPGEARRLACRAGILPAVLDGQSQLLDLGRTKRFHTKAQRVAMAVRDQGCTAEGCDWPPGLCHAHHDQTWATGGKTTLADGRLLCPRHHARAHDPTFTITKLPAGKVAFHRRT